MNDFEAVQQQAVGAVPHPPQFEVIEFGAYGLMIDARSLRESAEDCRPGAINLRARRSGVRRGAY